MDYEPCWPGRGWQRGAIVMCLCALLSIADATEPDRGSDQQAPTEPILTDPQRQTLRVVRFNDHATSDATRDVALEATMLSDFANSVGLEIEWVDVFRSTEALEKLIDGDGDLSISAIPIEHRDNARLLASEPIALQRFRVIGRQDETANSPLGLAGLSLAVKLSSPMWSYLDQLRAALGDLRLQVLPGNLSREDTLQMVSDGIYDATLIETEIGEEPLADFPRLRFLFDVTGPEPVSWFANRDNQRLIDSLNEFIKRYHAAYHDPAPSERTFIDIKDHGVLRVITRLDGNNYFLKRGQPAGFEFELARRFADKHGLRLEVLVGRNDDQILRWLRNGDGDIVTTRISANSIRGEPAFAMSREYRHDASVLVTSSTRPVRATAALHGKTIAGYEHSTNFAALESFIDGVGTGIAVDPQVSLELLLERVEAGQIDGVVIDAHRLDDVLATHGNLIAGMSIPNPYRYRWTLRGEDGPLARAVEDFIQSEYRKETYNVLDRRYVRARGPDRPAFADISPFDGLLQTYAERYGFDWRLIAAQMYQESHFDPTAISHAGAVGLMQLMPATAESMGFEDPRDPEAGIHAGVKYLDRLRDRFDPRIPMNDRTWLALAAYNIGYGRVSRARLLAHELGLNPDKWFDNVEIAMRQMTRSNGASAAQCRCGQAIIYVRSIRSLYYAYRNLVLAVKTPQQSIGPQTTRMRRLPARKT